MRDFLLILLSIFYFHHVQAQMQYDKNWLMGYNCCTPEGYEGMQIYFDEGVRSLEVIDHGLELSMEGFTMSNSLGDLLFYTNGCQIFDASLSLMENGDSLNFGQVYLDYCSSSSGYPAGTQSIISVPNLLNDSLYYIFHKNSRIAQNPLVLTDSFNITTINIYENNGLGKVIEKNKVFNVDTFRGQQITAIKHQNNFDWWINTPLHIGNAYKTFLLSNGQIVDTIEQSIGPFISSESNGSGHSIFSHDGTKFFQYLPTEDLIIFDFDRSTGLFSNPVQIEPDDDIEDGFGGIALSPNGRFLYVNSFFNLHQYDLEAEDIKASEYLVAEFDGFADPFPTGFFRPQLGLDCKIYMATFNGTEYLHVINQPDLPGAACDFVQRGIELPYFNSGTMPHYPNYRLDTEFPLCTPAPVSVTETASDLSPIHVFPNPVSDYLNLVFGHSLSNEGTVTLRDNLGRVVFQRDLDAGEVNHQIELTSLPRGLYFYDIEVEEEFVKSGKVVVIR